jgi:uncharacterized protein (DUF169 family)
MTAIEKNASYSRRIRKMLLLRYEPIAIKMIKDETEIPEGAKCPIRDMGKHIALCQAFAMARRDMKTIYMDKGSEWCWNPLIGFGFVECEDGSESFEIISKVLGIKDIDASREFFSKFPRLPAGQYTGLVVSPLASSSFEPDLMLIYCSNAQLRSMAWAIKNETGKLIETQLDAIDSCVYSCVVPLKTGEYRVTLPDVGEYERAMADEDEIILSVPGHRIEELVKGLHAFYNRGMGYSQLSREMQFEFPRPPFYNDLFKIWGLEQGKNWSRSV